MKKFYLSKCQNIAIAIIGNAEIRTFTIVETDNVKRVVTAVRKYNSQLFAHIDGEYTEIDHNVFQEFIDQFFSLFSAMLHESKNVFS